MEERKQRRKMSILKHESMNSGMAKMITNQQKMFLIQSQFLAEKARKIQLVRNR